MFTRLFSRMTSRPRPLACHQLRTADRTAILRLGQVITIRHLLNERTVQSLVIRRAKHVSRPTRREIPTLRLHRPMLDIIITLFRPSRPTTTTCPHPAAMSSRPFRPMGPTTMARTGTATSGGNMRIPGTCGIRAIASGSMTITVALGTGPTLIAATSMILAIATDTPGWTSGVNSGMVCKDTD
jgi:hypothetical protein